MQHERSNSLVATVAHSPPGARLRSECRPTMASAPPRPSGASPLTERSAISCLRPSPVTANSPSPHVATSIVGFVTDYLTLFQLMPVTRATAQDHALSFRNESFWPADVCAHNDFPAQSSCIEKFAQWGETPIVAYRPKRSLSVCQAAATSVLKNALGYEIWDLCCPRRTG